MATPLKLPVSAKDIRVLFFVKNPSIQKEIFTFYKNPVIGLLVLVGIPARQAASPQSIPHLFHPRRVRP
jgi:hypothetical protein